ncbi:MAG: META domain-containing protein [Balneolaceae bacterium]|nr:META domain-containing protein [Balneolaceae bacterium]
MILSSCSLTDGNESRQIELDRHWELIELVSSTGETLPTYDYEVHTLRFTNKSEFKGEVSCNNYGGKYEARKNGEIEISGIFVTEVFCRQPSLGDKFVQALTQVNRFEREAGQLILFYGKKGKFISSERLEH